MGDVRKSVGQLAARIADARSARPGEIVLRLTGEGGGTYQLSTGGKEVQVAETAGVDAQPLIEVLGDARAVQSVLDGKVDAREQFLNGGIRVRGDLRHLSDLALELGLLKHPL
ncbi:hypothetical protein [Amycolatopsis anabasis]|uniref:hypothetical protein n=1 Tax=Amycolatopsis anabasis TaxID=1840409 RepID=UPI00131E3730|nr:hypothetical protein [Amycolatopsis anabasis]